MPASHEIHAPATTADVDASDLITVLRDKAPRIALALAAGQAVWPVARALRTQARKRTTYTVKVSATDDIYDELHAWVLSILPSKDQRALVAWSTKRSAFAIDDVGDRSAPPALRLRYDGTREQVILVAGHKVKVVVSDGAGDEGKGSLKPPEIIFTAHSLAARQALLAEMTAVLHHSYQAKHQPSFRMLDKWGGWERLDDLPPRELSSVILPPGQLERLTGDVGRWLAAEADYNRRCIPWHRGHLYEGPPGTGKTSVARAIASHFGMDVWYLPLADVKKDGDLLRVVTRVSPRSMLLLEDIDVFHAATERKEGKKEGQVTLSGLLNTLDGVATPHGLFTVLTTNTPKVIDMAVSRPGRVDLVEHFACADDDQVARLMAHYYGRSVPGTGGLCDITPADVIEACKRHDDPAAAVADLAERYGRVIEYAP